MPPKQTKRPGYWKTIESREADAAVLVGVARSCHEDFDDLAAAKAALARALELEPTNSTAYGVLAEIHEAEGDVDGAMDLLYEYVKLEEPENRCHELLGRLSRLQEGQSDWYGVVASLHMVERLGLLFAEDWYRLGDAHLRLGELSQGIGAMGEAVDRGEERAMFRMATALHACGDWEAAEEAYEICSTELQRPCWAHAGLARMSCDQGDFKLAAQRVASTLGFDRLPGDMPVAVVEGDLLRRRDGDLAGARAKYEQAIAEEAGPEAVLLAHAGLGFVALEEGDAARALELFELAAASNDEQEPTVLLGLAQALAATGDPLEALPKVQRALSLRPGWAEAVAAEAALDGSLSPGGTSLARGSSAAGASAGAESDERPAKRSRRCR